MKVYLVKFKNKKSPPAEYHAYSYTQTDGKYYFHQKQDQSDHDTIIPASNVLSITLLGDAPPERTQPIYT